MPQHLGFARAVALVLLPFGGCYFLASTFRTINAIVGPRLSIEMGVSAGELGVLMSTYFAACALFQLPFGALLDRYGPRLVQAVLMLVGAGGALLTASSQSELSLLGGRVMIGIGMSVSLMAGLKAAATSVPRERLGMANSILVVSGAFGSIAATIPAGMLMDTIGWRGLFVVLSAASACLAGLLFIVVPKSLPGTTEPLPVQLAFSEIYRDGFFRRLAPLSTLCVGSAWALQSLWASMWFTDVEGMSRDGAVNYLFVMGISFCVGTLLVGVLADRLRLHSFTPAQILGCVASLLIAFQTLIVLRVPAPALAVWAGFSALSGMAGLSFWALGEHFRGVSSGRVNACLNVLHLGGAFLIQSVIGLIIDQWPVQPGRSPPPAS